MNTKELIEHLHNVHKLPLLQCNVNHIHPEDEQLILPDTFRFQRDAEFENSETAGACPLDAVCLIDCRKSDSFKRAKARILKRLQRDALLTAPATPDDASDFNHPLLIP